MPFAAHLWIVAFGCSLLAGCGEDDPSCTARDCPSDMPTLLLVDDAGQPVAARGELRNNLTEVAQPFDCSLSNGPPTATNRLACNDGVLAAQNTNLQGDTRIELRFGLAGGELSEWQTVALDITSDTDPDFNGPGCPCTRYEATAAPVLVPANARIYSAPFGPGKP
jgi:hypothetical protein